MADNKTAFRIYVGQLPYSTTNEELQQKFEEFGEVNSAQVIMDRATGRSKGFGFVEMADEESGRKAIEELDGKDFNGRTINVSEARPMEERPPRSDNFQSNR